MVGDDVRDDEARVVVHEDGHVDALMAPQAEGEDVRLPQLHRLCALEEPRRLRFVSEALGLLGN